MSAIAAAASSDGGFGEYVPLTDADRAALELYERAVALSESGGGDAARAAARLFKQAAAASPSLAYHFKLAPFSAVVEQSLRRLEDLSQVRLGLPDAAAA